MPNWVGVDGGLTLDEPMTKSRISVCFDMCKVRSCQAAKGTANQRKSVCKEKESHAGKRERGFPGLLGVWFSSFLPSNVILCLGSMGQALWQ